MEFIQGRELKNYFEANERFAPADIVRIMTQILDALGYSHKLGVIHRDIKPANVILLDGGRRQGRRFRHRPHRVVEHDAGGHGDGHAELHVARADHGASRRRALRSLLRRRHPVPVPDRRASVRRLGDRHDAQGAGGRSAAAVALQRAGAGRDGCRRAQGAREAARRALSERRRIRRRVARRRRAASRASARRHGAGRAEATLRPSDATRTQRMAPAGAAAAASRQTRAPRSQARRAREKVADDGHRDRRRRGRHRPRRGRVVAVPAASGDGAKLAKPRRRRGSPGRCGPAAAAPAAPAGGVPRRRKPIPDRSRSPPKDWSIPAIRATAPTRRCCNPIFAPMPRASSSRRRSG